MHNPVTVRKLKYDGSVKYDWDGDLVDGGDGWVATFHEAAVHGKSLTLRDEVPPFAIRYFWTGQPLGVLFCFDSQGTFTYAKCDASLPAEVSGRSVSFVDLDLDVVVVPTASGLSYSVKDQAVFAARRLSMGYSEEACRAANRGMGIGLRMVRRRSFPFDGSAEALLGRVLASEGPL